MTYVVSAFAFSGSYNKKICVTNLSVYCKKWTRDPSQKHKLLEIFISLKKQRTKSIWF